MVKFKKGDYIISKGGSEILHKIIRCNVSTYRLVCVYNPYSLKIGNPRLTAEGLWTTCDLPGNEWTKSFKYIEKYYKKFPKLKGALYETY